MKILVGVVAGIVTGVFFGEMTSWLEVAGDAYVRLLQMTVLPYVTVSLVSKVGRLTADQARTLGGRAGLVLLGLWGISLATVFVLPFSLPPWKAGTFFSTTLVEEPAKFDFLGLYLPTNPFHSLANNIVPAVVVFSIALGTSLIAVPRKQRLIEVLAVVSAALGGISNFVVRLAPYGTFALAAGAAGTLSPGSLARLSGYVSTYTLAIALLSFLVLPGVAATVTPFRFRKIVAGSGDAVLAAFATGKLFAVLPIIISGVQRMLVEQGVPEEDAAATADIYVPLGYPFPNAGKILALLFVPFAAWFIGRPLELSQYPMLLSVGLLALFGSPVAAIPFLLDMLRLPGDLLPLFLVAGIWCARIGDVLGAVHLGVFTLICASWNQGWLRFRPTRAIRWAGVTVVATTATLFVNHAMVQSTLEKQGTARDLFRNMDRLVELVDVDVLESPAPNPHPLSEGESSLDRIRRTKELRVGLLEKEPPFSHRNASGKRVGLDVDLIQYLALDLGAKVVLIPTSRPEIAKGFEEDRFDLVIGGFPSTVKNFDKYRESLPYLELHMAVLVRDYEVKDFRSLEAIRQRAARKRLRLGYEKDGLYARTRQRPPGLETVEIESIESYVRGETDVDGVLVSAESGAVITMLFPEYSVVIPQDYHVQVPVVFAVHDDPELQRLLDAWIRIRRDDGTVQKLYDYWILGRVPGRERKPRWSVIRNVLDWVD